MELDRFTRENDFTWRIEPHGKMRVPAIIYANESLIRDMDDKVYEEILVRLKKQGYDATKLIKSTPNDRMEPL